MEFKICKNVSWEEVLKTVNMKLTKRYSEMNGEEWCFIEDNKVGINNFQMPIIYIQERLIISDMGSSGEEYFSSNLLKNVILPLYDKNYLKVI